MQVNDLMDTEDNEVTGKKKREEREMQLAIQAENEKLLDKDWREGTTPRAPLPMDVIGIVLMVAWLQKWKEDPFDETKWSGRSVSNGSKASSGKGKGKEKA
jgi:hypothetical protein